MLEPCYHCLTEMVDNYAQTIIFAVCHKDKWNTPEYIQYSNDIFNKEVRSNSGRPVGYCKVNNKAANKFYKVEEK